MPPDSFPTPIKGRSGILPDALDAALEEYFEEGVEVVADTKPIPQPQLALPDPRVAMDQLAKICHSALQYRNLLGGPLENRTLFELRVIATENGQDFFLSLHSQGKQGLKNDNNMIVPWLLGVTEEFDAYSPPKFATGDLASICLPMPEPDPVDDQSLGDYLGQMGIHVNIDPLDMPPVHESRDEPQPDIVVEPQSIESVPFDEPVVEPVPQPQRKISQMRGFDALRQAKQRKENLEAQVILAAHKAAEAIANEIGFEVAFPALKENFGKGYAITKQGDLWCLATTNGDSKHLHPKWNYQESRQFGIHVKDGLIDAFAATLHSHLDEEEKALGSFALPDTEIPTNTVGLDVSDQDVLSALAHSSDSIPTLKSKDFQCIDCGTLYGLEIAKNSIPPNECPTCHHKGCVVPVSSLPGGKPIVDRTSLKTG